MLLCRSALLQELHESAGFQQLVASTVLAQAPATAGDGVDNQDSKLLQQLYLELCWKAAVVTAWLAVLRCSNAYAQLQLLARAGRRVVAHCRSAAAAMHAAAVRDILHRHMLTNCIMLVALHCRTHASPAKHKSRATAVEAQQLRQCPGIFACMPA